MSTTPTLWGNEVVFAADTTAGGSKVTGLQDNNFAIVWGDGLGDLHGRRYSAMGNVNSTDFLFNMSQAADKPLRLPELIQHENGEMGVYFNLTFDASAGDGDIYINAPDFDTIGGRTFKATVADRPYDEFMRDVAATTLSNAPATAVLINTPRGSSAVSDLYLAYTTTGGLIFGSPQVVPIPTGESVVDASVTGLPNGNTLVAYHTANVSTGEHFVRYRIYDDYTDLTGPRNAAATPGNDTFPATAALENSSDGFVIVTQDALGLRFLYSGYGNAFTKSVPGSLSNGGGAFAKAISPEVTSLKDGGFMIVWTDTSATEGDGTPALKVVVQRFDKFGNAVGDNLFIDAPGDQSLDSIDRLDDGRVVVTYRTETGDSTDQHRLAYQIVDPRDALIFGTSDDDTIVSREGGAKLVGFEGMDKLIGRAGDDILDGGRGQDTMRGGKGDDVYVVDSHRDTVIEKSGEGYDTIRSSVSLSLEGRHVEKLVLTGGDDINATGNSRANALIGNAGDNHLAGGRDRDVLDGKAGADSFVYSKLSDSTVGAAGRDTIVLFNRGQGDEIDLRQIDANTHKAGNQAFHFIGDSAFSGREGELRADVSGGHTLVSGDVNGDGRADFAIRIGNAVAMRSGDFDL